MKHLLSLLLFLLLTGASTKTYSQNNNIGVHLSYNSISGLNGEVRYEKMIQPRWLLSTGTAYNFRFAHSFNVGFKYDLLKNTKFSLFTGMDYKFESLKYSESDSKRITQNSLEIPMEFRYHLSNKMSLNAGLSIPFSLDKGREVEDLFIFRFGAIRRF
jgi:hypothetical protein